MRNAKIDCFIYSNILDNGLLECSIGFLFCMRYIGHSLIFVIPKWLLSFLLFESPWDRIRQSKQTETKQKLLSIKKDHHRHIWTVILNPYTSTVSIAVSSPLYNIRSVITTPNKRWSALDHIPRHGRTISRQRKSYTSINSSVPWEKNNSASLWVMGIWQ